MPHTHPSALTRADHAPAAIAPPRASFRAVAGLSLELAIDSDCEPRSGEWAPIVIAQLRTRDGTLIVWHKAPLALCRPGHAAGSTDSDDPSLWLGRCSIELRSVAEAARAARWLLQQQAAA